VGVGVSQVLPIVAQLALGSNDTVLLEQPELHLHPKAQADLGDLLVESVGLGKQVIAETHSEHLLLRVLRRIRQGTLAPGDVSVLYVDAGDSGSSVQELRLDSRGEFLDEWPNGFFEERIDELFD
jgi:predicted ATPase